MPKISGPPASANSVECYSPRRRRARERWPHRHQQRTDRRHQETARAPARFWARVSEPRELISEPVDLVTPCTRDGEELIWAHQGGNGVVEYELRAVDEILELWKADPSDKRLDRAPLDNCLQLGKSPVPLQALGQLPPNGRTQPDRHRVADLAGNRDLRPDEPVRLREPLQ